MDWKKVFKKAAVGAMTGLPVAGVTMPGSIEEAVPSLVAALGGALINGFINWWKNRKN